MRIEKIYNLFKAPKVEYTEYSYRSEIEKTSDLDLEIEFGELESICDAFEIPGQTIENTNYLKEGVHYKKHLVETENSAYVEGQKIILETNLKFEKGKEIPEMIERMKNYHNKK